MLGGVADSLWICAGAPGIDACSGDSGGPLFAKEPDGSFVQMGVVSHGPPDCGAVGRTGVYADLNEPHIRNFIRQTIHGAVDPCVDGLDPAGERFGLEGERIESDGEFLLVATYPGRVCPRSRIDAFRTSVPRDPIAGRVPFVAAKLSYDEAAGGAELRLRSCDEKGCLDPLAPTAAESRPGSRSLRWENTTGQVQSISVEEALAGGGRVPLSYSLELIRNAPPPPPPPPPRGCGNGLPSDDQLFFVSPGTYRFEGTVCANSRVDNFVTELPHAMTVNAGLRAAEAGPIQLVVASCDFDFLECVNQVVTMTDETGAASAAWTNCTGGSLFAFLDVTLPNGDGPVTYELTGNSAASDGCGS